MCRLLRGQLEGATAPLLHVQVPDSDDVLERLLDGTRWPRRWVGA